MVLVKFSKRYASNVVFQQRDHQAPVVQRGDNFIPADRPIQWIKLLSTG